MKTRKSGFIFGMIFALTAAVLTGCSAPDSNDEEKDYGNFKVECGVVEWSVLEDYQNWMMNLTSFGKDDVKAQRDIFYSKTNAGTYQDKGTLSTSELRKFLIANGEPEDFAEEELNTAGSNGFYLTGLPNDKTLKTAMRVYMEKEGEPASGTGTGTGTIVDLTGSFNPNVSYTVETGTISMTDYMTFQDWKFSTAGYSYESYRAERDVLFGQTTEWTYTNRGTLTATELKALLVQNGSDSESADSSLNLAERYGSEITGYANRENGSIKSMTWVYFEKIK